MSTADSTPLGGTEPLTTSSAEELLANFDFEDERKAPEPEAEPDTAADEADGADQDDTPSEEAEEAPEEAESTDTEAEASDDEESRTVRLRDGREITLAELKKAYGREADYTRKTQELAEQRKQFETRQAQISQQEQHFHKAINHALQVAQAKLPAKPDPALADADPIEYFVQKDKFERAVNEIRGLQHAKAQQEAEEQKARDAEFEDYVDREKKALTEKVPEFKSEKARKAFWAEAQTVASESWGYSSKELSKVVDHRLMLVIKDAVAYRKLQSEKPKAVVKAKDAPPVQTPGKRPSQTEQVTRQKTELFSRLKATGSAKDGEAILSRFD